MNYIDIVMARMAFYVSLRNYSLSLTVIIANWKNMSAQCQSNTRSSA